MKKYYAILTPSGLYTMVVAKKEVSSTSYQLKGNIVYDKLVIDEDGQERLLNAKEMNYKEFSNYNDCAEFIGLANKF